LRDPTKTDPAREGSENIESAGLCQTGAQVGLQPVSKAYRTPPLVPLVLGVATSKMIPLTMAGEASKAVDSVGVCQVGEQGLEHTSV
jgi:hypothetical protein